MNSFAILLVIVSTFMHASWNLIAKNSKSGHDFVGRLQISVIVIGLIPAVVSEYFARSIPPRAWLYLAMSGLSCSVYYLSLASAYKVSDFTIVYPVARALPVLLMGFVDMGRGRVPSPIGWAGMFMVAAGCMLSPLESIREITLGRYLNKATLWIFLTAMGTVGYSTSDKFSSEIVSQGAATAARYGYFFFIFSGIFYLSARKLLSLIRQPGNEPKHKIGWVLPTVGGILGYASYWLVLWAYQMVGRASYVVTFRQFSIVIGAIAAFILYREKGLAVRMFAVITITAGLVIIALWG